MFKFWKEFLKAEKEEREGEAVVEQDGQCNPKTVNAPPPSLDQPSETCSEIGTESSSNQVLVESEPESIDWNNPDSVDKIALGITTVPGYVKPDNFDSIFDKLLPDPYETWCHGIWDKERRGINPRKWPRSKKDRKP